MRLKNFSLQFGQQVFKSMSDESRIRIMNLLLHHKELCGTALELILAGASGVSVGTASFGNPSAVMEIQRELHDLLVSKGFPSLKSAVGYAHRVEEK